MTADSETLRVYGNEAERYLGMTEGLDQLPALTDFISRLPRGGHALDLGCGPGWAAVRMATEGLRVTAIDATQEMVDMVAKMPGVTAQLATFDDIDGTELYDGIWAHFSLLHTPREDLPRHLAALAQALKPGGWFHIGMKTGSGEKRDPLGRRYTYVTQEELNTLLRATGLTPVDAETGETEGLDGVMAPWVIILAHG
ncbi:MAG: class I SAM-dependent methyltransferase [Pseudomonadota bacterium]